ncbi:hypothetical protein [Chachezhania sediminis]|uniref:hypothetical protein n=1 Tax=Chachezhania sediminis TaxID=2599291 RepID=UPI00131C628C|nr:hypothetical protein [Chachezhania sediminis]
MPDPTPRELAAIQEQRRAMFRPPWLRDLVAGRLTVGETFWAGHLGLEFVCVPTWFILMIAIRALPPGGGLAVMGIFTTLQSVLSVLVTLGVIRSAWTSRTRGWRWVAVIFSLIFSAASVLICAVTWTGEYTG